MAIPNWARDEYMANQKTASAVRIQQWWRKTRWVVV